METNQSKPFQVFLYCLCFFFSVFLLSCDSDSDDPGQGPEDPEPILEEIAMGAALHGTNGLFFGPDDNLYIASFYGQEILSLIHI